VSTIQQQESSLVVRSSVFRTVLFLIDKLTVIAISYDVACFMPFQVDMFLVTWSTSAHNEAH
jgi:hypothetical protein